MGHNAFASALINLYYQTFMCLPGKTPSRIIASSAQEPPEGPFCARWSSPDELVLITVKRPELVFPEMADDFVMFVQ